MSIPILYLPDESGEYCYYIGRVVNTDYGQMFEVDEGYPHNGFETVSDTMSYLTYISEKKEENRKTIEEVK